MTQNFIQLSTYIERSQDDALNSISTKRTTKQEHIRRAIDFYLEENYPPYARPAGLAKAAKRR